MHLHSPSSNKISGSRKSARAMHRRFRPSNDSICWLFRTIYRHPSHLSLTTTERRSLDPNLGIETIFQALNVFEYTGLIARVFQRGLRDLFWKNRPDCETVWSIKPSQTSRVAFPLRVRFHRIVPSNNCGSCDTYAHFRLNRSRGIDRISVDPNSIRP